MKHVGTIYLVGAGPGDPQLITLRAREVLARADIVLYDYLVNPEILRHVGQSAELICLGRHGRGSLWPAEAIHQRLVQEATSGKCVVRLKGGDSLVFGRITGEIESLVHAKIPFEIVPGITAAMAAASYAGVPLTDRCVASAVAFVTGQETIDKDSDALDYGQLAQFPGTLVIYMGITTARAWSTQLMAAGMPGDRPVALIRRCSWPNQEVLRCRLDEVSDRVTPFAKFPPPAIAIVGEVTRERPQWNWFEQRPLFGHTIVVTRPRDQAFDLQSRLVDLGAEVLLQPAIEIQDPSNWRSVDAAIARLADYDDVVFSSANGVERFLKRLWSLGGDTRALAQARLAAIGPGTTQALAQFQLRTDVQPQDDYRAESLLACLAAGAAGRKILMVRASRGREVLADGLRSVGADVEQIVAYESVDVPCVAEDIAERLARIRSPWITVTSSAIARSSARLLRESVGSEARWVSLSPITSIALRELGIEPAAEAQEATMEGLVQALLQVASPG